MKAVVYNKKGSPEKLVYCDVDKPVPGEDEVLIKVHAVSLNAADYRSMKMGMIPKKKIFGADIAGVVEKVGKNIKEFRPGDAVLGDLGSYGFGGLAEYAVAPVNLVIHKPGNVSFEAAAAIPMAALTALQALRDKAGAGEGRRVLIVGSAGGVGTFAVQLARYFKSHVTGVCSTRNVNQTISLGADEVIDYTKEDFAAGGRRYDIIIAVSGNYPLRKYRRILADSGIYVMVGGGLPQIFKSLVFGRFLSLGSRKMKFLAAKANKTDLEFLVKLVEQGKIKPVIDRRYTLENTAEAMNYLQMGHSAGKIIINTGA